MTDTTLAAIIGGILATGLKLSELLYDRYSYDKRIKNIEEEKLKKQKEKFYNTLFARLDSIKVPIQPITEATLKKHLRYYACHGNKKQFKFKYEQWRQFTKREKWQRFSNSKKSNSRSTSK